MSKIPVFDTVGETYTFSFRHYLKLLAITWLPLLIVTAVSFYILRQFLPENIAFVKVQMMAPGTPFAHPPMAARIWLLNFAMLFLMVMIAVGITKEVLGVREDPRFLYFRFGADELRLLVGLVGIVLILAVAIVGAGIVASIVAAMTMGGGTQQDGAAVAATIIRVMLPILFVLYLIGFYFFVRLAFFLPPVVVSEKRIGVGRSWELSSGNFWRIFAIGLFIWIPMVIIELVVFGAIMGPSIATAIANGPHTPQMIALAVMEAEVAQLPYILGLSFFLSPLFYGLIVAPAAFAYKAVQPQAPAV